MNEVRRIHHPDCSYGATTGPGGDFCNCKMVVQAPDFDALVARVQAVEREIASQEVQMNAVRYRAEQAEQQVARLRKFAEFIKNERREQWHRWADEADDPAPTDNEIETFDEQFREACKALRETGAYQEVKKTT